MLPNYIYHVRNDCSVWIAKWMPDYKYTDDYTKITIRINVNLTTIPSLLHQI